VRDDEARATPQQLHLQMLQPEFADRIAERVARPK
jgi:hypothetical protein